MPAAKPFAEDLVIADLDLGAVFRSRLHDPRLRKGRLEERCRRKTRRPCNVGDVGHVARQPWDRPGGAAPDREACAPRDLPRSTARSCSAPRLRAEERIQKLVVGLSGGIDSALGAVIAADALGPETVTGVSMPSRYSSEGCETTRATSPRNLGIRYLTSDREDLRRHARDAPSRSQVIRQPARRAPRRTCRRASGAISMALSNKFGSIVLTTGNKSEMAVGYATSTATWRGLRRMKDVPKTLVFAARALAQRARRGDHPVAAHEAALGRAAPRPAGHGLACPPTKCSTRSSTYVEEDRSARRDRRAGATTRRRRRSSAMVDLNEYKRRQAPAGRQDHRRAFGRDRRLPITNRYRDGGAASKASVKSLGGPLAPRRCSSLPL